jgi:FHA domain
VTELLFIEEQPVQGAERRVRPGTTVGRIRSDIVLPDPQVSRRHAVFHQIGAGLGVEDLGSQNGTYVNGRRIEGVTSLNEGDSIRFGGTVWRLGASDPDRLPSAIRHAVPTTAFYGELPSFDAADVPSPVLGFSAARILGATIFCYLVILVTAVGVTLFFVTR